MDLFIDHESIQSGVQKLAIIGSQARDAAGEAAQNSLNASFSGVSGLDQLGGNHGGVINGGAGSAITVLQSYAEQVSWLSGALAASYEALTGQNAFVARGMDIADEGGAIGQDGVSFPTRPRPRFESFTFTPPVVLPASSIGQLSAAFSATKIQDSVMAARMWHQMSADVAGIAAQLQAVASDLGSRNRGDVIEVAIEKVAEVARAGETFAMNSQVMGATVERLSFIKQKGAVTVNLAQAAISTIVDPVARAAAEASFLSSFPASYTPTVAAGIPPIRNLMVMDPTPDGGGEVALGGGSVEGTGAKHDASGLRAPGAPLESVTSLQRAIGAGEFGTVQSGTNGLASVGANVAELGALIDAAEVGTTAASTGTLPAPSALGITGAPSVPASTGAASTLGGAVAPMGTPAVGGGGFRASRSPGSPGSPGAIGSLGTTGGVGAPGAFAAPGVLGSPGATSSPLTAGSFNSQTPVALNQAGTAAAGAGRAPLATGGMAPMGIMPGPARSGRAGNAVTGLGGGGAVSVPAPRATTGSPAVGAGGGVGAASRSTMMPMMGAPLAGHQQQKATKVRAVTSAVEEEGNVAALLGDRPAVVPGVIGAWARG